MAPETASKRRLDTRGQAGEPTAVRSFLFVLLSAAALPRIAAAQAPALAELWRIAAGTLSSPAALGRGPTGAFWNPAAVYDLPGLAGGIEVLQTPDVVSLSGVMGGVTQRIGRRIAVGALVGRLSIKGLVRTTTSPTSELGEIPVYAQLAGLSLGVRVGPAVLATMVRVHDTRVDARSDGGTTVDVGVRLEPTDRLTLAAASRFAPAVLGGDRSTDYGVAGEYRIRTTTVWGARTLVVGRYGINYRPDVGVEHGFSAGVALQDRLRVDLGWTREQGFGTTAWRSVVSVGLLVGRYAIEIARGSGFNGLGASFRLSLNANILP